METLQLREWTLTPALTLTGPQRDTLRTVFKATVQSTFGSNDRYDVRPGNTVGVVTVDGTTFIVEPKISISRVLFLLSYTADPTAWRPEDADLGTATDLVSAIIGLFTNLCDRALGRGLLNGYHSVEADLYTVRGRIDLAEQLRRRPGLDLPLAVRYEEHNDDITENRLLLAAATLLRGIPIRVPATRRSMHRVLEALQNVTAQTYRPNQIPGVTWTRLNIHYRPAVELARLLLALHAPDLTSGPHRTASLTIDMATLFEQFVREALREALHVNSSQFPDGFACQPLHLDSAEQIGVLPDLSLWIKGQCRFIGDVKYKRDTGQGHNDDLYQLLAYATAAQLPVATLVYAQGPPTPSTHHVVGTPIRLAAQHMDLSRQPSDLLDQIWGLAAQIAADAEVHFGEAGVTVGARDRASG